MSASQQIQAQPKRLERTTWQEYALRFAFGGIVTAAVGIVGVAFGPIVAGLFLAFPAILPASATLIERHDGKRNAGGAALGAAAGAVGLLAFGEVVWWLASRLPAAIVLGLAGSAWLLVSLVVWWTAQRVQRSLHG